MTANSLPRYQQLKDLIIERIGSGELQPSDRVPSEHELVDATGVSRMTANRALRELNDEGYVDRVAGVGTFVAAFKADSHLLEVRNIADEIALRGHDHSATVLCREAIPADEQIAAALNLEAGVEVNHVRLVHQENSLPIQLENRFVSCDFAPELLEQDFYVQTPSAYMNSVAPLQEAEHIVRAQLPDSNIREHLQMTADEPCLVVTRRTWVQGRPVSFAQLYHPGSRFELSGHFEPRNVKSRRHVRGGGAN